MRDVGTIVMIQETVKRTRTAPSDAISPVETATVDGPLEPYTMISVIDHALLRSIGGKTTNLRIEVIVERAIVGGARRKKPNVEGILTHTARNDVIHLQVRVRILRKKKDVDGRSGKRRNGGKRRKIET